MNNIYFFYHFNNLLKTHIQTQKDINHLIDDKEGHIVQQNQPNMSEKELFIVNKYKDLLSSSELFLSKLSFISNDIKDYLYENCTHDWTIDEIDISLDISKQIKYCNYCESTSEL
jgi:hypothetical protein